MSKHFNELYLRTLSKVISWRIIQFIVYTANTYIITGNLNLGMQIAVTAMIVNSGLYWVHERFWNSFDWKRQHDNELNFTENQSRSIGKMVTWRILMIFSVYLVAFINTGNWAASLSIMSAIILVNIVVYWIHERVWNQIKLGKKEYATK